MTTSDHFQGQPAVRLATAGGDQATILLHGAHVVSWVAAGTQADPIERLYLSPQTGLGGNAAIRGGVPVVFPQFNQRGPGVGLPKHGFVRNRAWSIAAQATDSVALALVDDDATRGLWPHPFRLSLRVTLTNGGLDLALTVGNTGTDPFAFTAALHTYLAVGDIGAASVAGLAGIRYLDTVIDADGVGNSAPLRFDGETDRIYWNAKSPLALTAPTGPLAVSMDGFEDAVIWNPWIGRAAALPDLPDDGWRRMLCIEAARIARPVILEPAGSWTGRQALVASLPGAIS